MPSRARRILWCVFLLSAVPTFVSPVAAGTFDAGSLEFRSARKAIERGDHAEAAPILEVLAREGNHVAQWMLGDLYKNGEGVRRDLDYAVLWYRKAISEMPSTIPADPPQGEFDDGELRTLTVTRLNHLRSMAPIVTATLGTIHFKGEGTVNDPVEAYKWFVLADHYRFQQASTLLAFVEKTLTEAELEEGRNRAEAWLADHERFNGRFGGGGGASP